MNMNKFKYIAEEKILAPKTPQFRRGKNEEQEYCDYCDGCGWVEGGETINTRCPKCKGSGIKIKEKDEFEGGIFP